MLISMMKSRSSLTRLIGAGLLTASMAVGVAGAQDAAGDANARTPEIIVVPVEGGEAHFVVGQMAWGDTLGLLNQIHSQTDVPSDEMVQRLWIARDETPPFFLFELARLTADSDPAFAVQAYFIGRARTMYDAARCLDSTALDVINEASSYAGDTVIEVMAERPELTVTAIESLIASGGAFTGTASPWWACSFGTNAYYAAVNGDTLSGNEWLMIESRWPSVRERISANLQNNLEMLRTNMAAAAD